MTPAEKKARLFIIIASLAIPIVVSILYFMPKLEAANSGLRSFLNQLPMLNATINGTTAVVLVAAFIAIKKKNIKLHKNLMTLALVLSVIFLIFYVSYHSTTDSTRYPHDAPYRGLYIFVLLTHILLSAMVVPFVLVSYTRALAERFDKHKRLAKITLPIWLYVAITGVIVYLMISPYYNF
ncbi:MAG TPA: DUF420 domain-containing protein [Flavobacteriales bacterium]